MNSGPFGSWTQWSGTRRYTKTSINHHYKAGSGNQIRGKGSQEDAKESETHSLPLSESPQNTESATITYMRGPREDPCRLHNCHFHLCEHPWALLSWFSLGHILPVSLTLWTLTFPSTTLLRGSLNSVREEPNGNLQLGFSMILSASTLLAAEGSLSYEDWTRHHLWI